MAITGNELYYTGPDGRRWQLQGPNQNQQPATLLRKPVGLFGPPVDVQRRRVLASRNTFRVSTLPQQSNFELAVELVPPDSMQRSMHNDAGAKFYETVSRWLDAWPVDDGTSVAPKTGVLEARHPAGGRRYLDVYRTEEVESLLPLDPMVAMQARFLMVCSSDDPYPRLDDEVSQGSLVPGTVHVSMMKNPGQIAVAPRITVDAPPAQVAIKVNIGNDVLASFTFQTPGPGTFDLDPNALTYSLAGDVKPLEWWWEPNISQLGKAAQAILQKFGTPAASVTPIAAPWGQNADALVPAGSEVQVNVQSSAAGKFKVELTPRVERLLF